MRTALDSASAARERSAVLGKAVMAAATRLGIRQTRLARVLGLSPASVSRIGKGQLGLAPDSKQGELALLFVRLFRSLDAITGSDAAARQWLDSHNHALGGCPADLILTAAGLVDVVAYLDSQRARI